MEEVLKMFKWLKNNYANESIINGEHYDRFVRMANYYYEIDIEEELKKGSK